MPLGSSCEMSGPPKSVNRLPGGEIVRDQLTTLSDGEQALPEYDTAFAASVEVTAFSSTEKRAQLASFWVSDTRNQPRCLDRTQA